MREEITNAETLSGFPVARLFYLTELGGALVVNIVTDDGRNIRQEASKEQVVAFFIAAAPHVVRA